MAVVTTKSTLLTNRDATPKVLTDSFISGGQGSESYGWVTANVGDSIASYYKCVSVPSNCRISSIRMVNAALGASVTVDIGVWYPTAIQSGGGNFLAQSLAGTLINSTCIQTAIACSSATTVFQDVVTTAVTSPSVQEQPFWQLVGLTTDPEIWLDVGFVVRAAAIGTQGQIAMRFGYIF